MCLATLPVQALCVCVQLQRLALWAICAVQRMPAAHHRQRQTLLSPISDSDVLDDNKEPELGGLLSSISALWLADYSMLTNLTRLS